MKERNALFLKGGLIGRNSTVKSAENFTKHNAKTSPETSLPLPRNRKNSKRFQTFMKSMTMFTPIKNLFNFVVSKSPSQNLYKFV